MTRTKTEPPRTIRLTNGTSFTINSNEATTTDLIPTIDVSGMYSSRIEDRQAVAEEVRDASRKVGFFLIVNHRIEPELATQVLEQAKTFFALPLEKKMHVAADLIPDEFCGYHPMEHYNINGAAKRDLHEAFNWNYDAAKDPNAEDLTRPVINLWPAGMPEFQDALCKYQTALIQFARRLTRIFALALHMPEMAFDEFVKTPEAGARILHYPQQNASREDQNGIGAHTDVEYFTIISQDAAGLEVLSKDGGWLTVPPVPGSFVVNIADCFMRQTNDFFVSTVHRVINETGRERYSVPFFWGFDRRTVMEPVPTCVSKDNPSKYEVMTAGEYYLWRTRTQREQWRGLVA